MGHRCATVNRLRLSQDKVLATPISLGSADNLKVFVTAKEGSKASRPHQTFLNVRDPKTGLETSFPFQVKDSGKGKLEIVSFHSESE